MNNTLYVVGLGPGDASCLTPLARESLARATCIVGYPLYIELVPSELLAGKHIMATGMRHETERCQQAIDAALAGEVTAIVCSGDAGVYALAGLVLELLELGGTLDQVDLQVVPGIPAVCAGAALLGAPLTHDFACISLSDLLTPWPAIYKRLDAALGADFVCVLYNPRSRGRTQQLPEALALARRHRPPDCPVGLVQRAFRPKQKVTLTTLADLDPEWVDMLSILFIGNSESRRVGSYFLTPRGYDKKRFSGLRTPEATQKGNV